MPQSCPIAVVGATGRLGRLVVARLVARGKTVRAISRSADRLQSLQALGVAEQDLRPADIRDPATLSAALAGCCTIVNTARARFTDPILVARPPSLTRLVVVGSTRRYTRYPDQTARALIAVEESLAKEDTLIWSLLHPTMIYGSAGEDNLQRVARLAKLSPVIFLPQGGKALIQPIHVEDVADATVAAALAVSPPTGAMVVAGAEPMTYADLVRAVGQAVGRRPTIMPLPYALVQAAAFLLRTLPIRGLPKIEAAEVQRLLEDKDFDSAPTVALLGRRPRDLRDGLGEMFDKR